MTALIAAYAFMAHHPALCLGQPLSAEPIWKFYIDSDYGGYRFGLRGVSEPGNAGRPQLGALATCGGTPVLSPAK